MINNSFFERKFDEMSGLIEKFKEMWNPSEEYEKEETFESKPSPEESSGSDNGKIISLNTNPKLKVVLARPERFGEEIKNIADHLLKMHPVMLNLEVTPKSESRRLVDFLSGIAYAIGGKIKKVSSDTFIVTPRNVDIEGEDLLNEFQNQDVYF